MCYAEPEGNTRHGDLSVYDEEDWADYKDEGDGIIPAFPGNNCLVIGP